MKKLWKVTLLSGKKLQIETQKLDGKLWSSTVKQRWMRAETKIK